MPFWNKSKKPANQQNPPGGPGAPNTPVRKSQHPQKGKSPSAPPISPSPANPKMQKQPQPQQQSRSQMQPPPANPGQPEQLGKPSPQKQQQARGQPQQQAQYPRQQNQPAAPQQQQTRPPQQNQQGRGPPQQQQGYPPQQNRQGPSPQQGYPQQQRQQQGPPPQQGYTQQHKQQQGPPPQQQGYPPQQGQQQGPPPQQGYQQQQRQQQGPPSQQQGYPPQQMQQQGGPSPQQQGYPPQQYQQQGQQGGYAPQYQHQGGPPPRPQSNYVGGHPSPGLQSNYIGGGGYAGQSPMVSPMVGMQPAMHQMGAVGGAAFMPAPAIIPGIPNGLEYLAAVDHIIVDQLIEMIELISNIEGANMYSLKNAFGQQVYFAMEESNPMMRQMMGKERQFTMRITDNWQREVIRVHRPFKQFGMPIDACFIECPLGVQIGRVVLQGFIAPLTLTVEDTMGHPMFVIRGPICPMGNYGDQIFPITCAQTMQQVGAITKKFGGMAKEMYTDADTFVVNFPMAMDVYMKACILGANFLIDFLLYEDNHKQPGGMMALR